MIVSVQLREYQATQLSSVVGSMNRGCKRNLLVLPTGGGKGAIASYMLGNSAQRGNDAWITVHRRELALQVSENLSKYGVAHGMVMSGMPLQPWHKVQVVLIGSLKKRARLLRDPVLIIPDEAHHCRAKTFEQLFLDHPDAYFIGLTATPQRLDGRGLGKWFESMHVGAPMSWLIRQGFLSDYRLFAPPAPDMSQVASVGGDFNAKQAKAVLAKTQITGDAIREYTQRAPGQRALVRSLDIESSKDVCASFCRAGIHARHVDGGFDERTRRKIFDEYQEHRFDVLCNVELAGEGVDIPGIQVAIDLRPTKSLTSLLQFEGRALRPVYAKGMPLDTAEQRLSAIKAGPKPFAILLDHVGNSHRPGLGLPDDAREWTLDDNPKKPKAAPIWTCRQCYGTFREPHRICPSCGAVMSEVGGGRAPVEQVDGKLEEIDREKRRAQYEKEQAKFKERHDRKRAISECKTLEQLQQYAKEHGYKEGWANHILEVRKNYAHKYQRSA